MKEQLLFGLDMAWQLFEYHTADLGEQEGGWAFSDSSLQVRLSPQGWVADWPHTQAYEIGPSSINWILWHMLYWWLNAFAANLGEGEIKKENICWPASTVEAVAELHSLHDRWVTLIDQMDEEELASPLCAHWPFAAESFGHICIWLNGELLKNAAEIGTGRFLYAAAHT